MGTSQNPQPFKPKAAAPGDEKETYFSYEELQRICELAGRQIETVH